MSIFNINDTEKTKKDKSIVVDYYEIPIYYYQYVQSSNNGGHVEIPFRTTKNLVDPNAIYFSSEPTIKYRSNKLFIYKKSHNIQNLEYDGELIIENISTHNENDVLYVCFPLKTNFNKKNSIDKVIQMSEKIQPKNIKMDITVNSLFDDNQKYVFYNDGNKKIIIFTNPIEVSSKFDKYAICDKFSLYVDDYAILQNISAKEGFQEGATTIDSKTSQMTCVPILDSGEVVKDPLLVNYLNSTQMKQNNTINMLFSMVLFIIIFCISFFGAPFVYKSVFMDKNNSKNTNQLINETLLFSIFYLLLCTALFIGGFTVPNDGSLITGIFLFVLWGISALTIYNKFNSDSKYYEGFNGIGNKTISIADILKIFGDLFNNFYLLSKDSNINIHYFILAVLCLGFLVVIILLNTKSKKKTIIAPNKSKSYKDHLTSMFAIFGIGYSAIYVYPFIYDKFIKS
jgi:hypothetical protein